MMTKFGLIAALAVAVSMVGPSVVRDGASGADELQPNLQALPASELILETRDGRDYLRFSATTWNNGRGPLELVAGEVDTGNDNDTGNDKQKVYQRIFFDDGTSYEVPAGWFVYHADHDHIHFESYATYTLQAEGAPGNSQAIGSKTTFCIIDTDRINHRLDGAPKRPVYTQCDADVQGMSVGWGDTYRYFLAGQELDVTEFESGTYRLSIEVDPNDNLVEIDDSEQDNTNSILIHLDVEAGTVQIVDEGGDDGGGNDCPPGKQRRNLC